MILFDVGVNPFSCGVWYIYYYGKNWGGYANLYTLNNKSSREILIKHNYHAKAKDLCNVSWINL